MKRDAKANKDKDGNQQYKRYCTFCGKIKIINESELKDREIFEKNTKWKIINTLGKEDYNICDLCLKKIKTHVTLLKTVFKRSSNIKLSEIFKLF